MKRVVVVGGGISGAATAFTIQRTNPDVEVMLLERGPCLGGTARSTVTDEGYTVDWGPNGFLTNVLDSVELAEELGLGPRLQPASEMAKFRFLFQDEALKPLPLGPVDFIKSDFVSWPGKLRMALEPFVPVPDDHTDETVHGFAARRLGREFADAFMRPMIIGITSGDAAATNLDALFPRMRKLEVDHGSLVKAMIAKARAGKADTGAGGPAGPGGRLTSFGQGGVQVMLDALSDALGDAVRVDTVVEGVEAPRRGEHWRVSLSGGEEVEADAVVLATPAYVSAELVRGVSRSLAEALEAIPYTSVRVAALGYPQRSIPRPLDGFGFLVPRGQGVRILGCLWTSSIFPSQAPKGRALLRVICGGVFDPAIMELSDEEALWEIRKDLSRTMGITEPPELVRQIAWRRGIPQYEPEHPVRVARIKGALGDFEGGLHVVGNAYEGIGVNDCVRNARRVAHEVLASL